MKTIILSIIILLFAFSVKGQNANAIDAMFVIDNSASMKKNDPEFLLRKALSMFVKKLPEDTRTGYVIFSDKVDFFLPLAPAAKDTVQANHQLINFISYTGKYTNIPSAIEKAFYELKINGRKDNDRIIVFLTDGIMDLGGSVNKAEKATWLKDVITSDCKTEKIRIFSIAFTDQADFELLQTLSSKTGGSYFRALAAKDLPMVFENISSDLAKSRQTFQPAPEKEKPVEARMPSSAQPAGLSGSTYMLIIVVIVLIILGVIVFKLPLFRKKAAVLSDDEELPEAYLIDMSGVTNKSSFQIRKRITRIGRNEANDLHIPDEKNYVSSLHAILEFSGQNFYLIDQDSVNGTTVNGKKLEKKEKVILKGGDVISFDKYGFKFLCPAEGERGQTVMDTGTVTGTMTIQHLPENEETTGTEKSEE